MDNGELRELLLKQNTEMKAMRSEISELRAIVLRMSGLVRPIYNTCVNKPKLSDTDKELDRYFDESWFSTRAWNVLCRANIWTVRDLSYLCKDDIKKIRNCGKSVFNELFAVFEEHGISVADEKTEASARPLFNEGDPVFLRVPIYYNNKRVLEAGTELIVADADEDVHYGWTFMLPTYRCSVAGKENTLSYRLSPGQIRHL